MRRAFLYIRFSKDEQKDGTSYERQMELAKNYCRRNNLVLEKVFLDEGVSAYTGDNFQPGTALWEFLQRVREDSIPPDSYFLFENEDRFSRDLPAKADDFLMEILEADITVVTLDPEQIFTLDNYSDMEILLPTKVRQCLANMESKKKSKRIRKAKEVMRERARKGEIVSRRAPAWLRLTEGAWVVDEAKAALVRRIFDLCVEGYGARMISGFMNREHPEGLTGRLMKDKDGEYIEGKYIGWAPGYIRVLLRSRTVLGDYQPFEGTPAKRNRKSTLKPSGDPIRNYYPSIVSEAQFARAGQIMVKRRAGGGRGEKGGKRREGSVPNLFQGILVDAACGRNMVLSTSDGKPILVNTGSIRRLPGAKFRSILYEVFEPLLLDELKELKASDIVGHPGHLQDRLDVLKGRLRDKDEEIEELKDRVRKQPKVRAYLDLLGEASEGRDALLTEIAEAERSLASLPEANLKELQALFARMDKSDDMRRRVRSALRRLIDRIYLLIVPRGGVRVMQIQVYFWGSENPRTYIAFLRAARGRTPGAILVEAWRPGDPPHSFMSEWTADLRRPDHVEKLRANMEAFPAGMIEGLFA